MEQAARVTTSARLKVGVISFVPKAHSYRPYPTGNYANKPSASWHMSTPIHNAMGSIKPISLH